MRDVFRRSAFMSTQLPTEYTAIMTGEPFLYFELRQIARLKYGGLSLEEIRRKVYEENTFQYKTNKSVGRVLAAVIRRLNVLDDTLLHFCVNGSKDTSRLVALYGVAKTNLLFFEFLEEVYREKRILGDEALTSKDMRTFFTNKKQESDKVASWSELTIRKLSSVYQRVAHEAGLIDSDQIAIPPFVEESLEQHLLSIGDHRFLTILSEVR